MIHLTLIIFIFHFTCEEHFVVEFYVQSSTCNKIDLLKKSLCGDIRKEVSILVIFYHANVGINIQSSRIDIRPRQNEEVNSGVLHVLSDKGLAYIVKLKIFEGSHFVPKNWREIIKLVT